eukprot:355289-Amphidinium_carterae.1
MPPPRTHPGAHKSMHMFHSMQRSLRTCESVLSFPAQEFRMFWTDGVSVQSSPYSTSRRTPGPRTPNPHRFNEIV